MGEISSDLLKKAFFSPSFFSFCYLFAAVIDLLLGLLPVQKILRKHHQYRLILPWSKHMQLQSNFDLSFSVKFWSIFVHSLGSAELITLI